MIRIRFVHVSQETHRAHAALRAGAAGFTLVEVSVATLVVGVLIASILTTVLHGFAILAASRQTLRANQILQQELETLRTYSWSQVTNTASYGSTNYLDGQINYLVTRSMMPYANGTSYGTNQMRRVTITIVWTNAPGRVISKNMTTLFTQGGLNDYIY